MHDSAFSVLALQGIQAVYPSTGANGAPRRVIASRTIRHSGLPPIQLDYGQLHNVVRVCWLLRCSPPSPQGTRGHIPISLSCMPKTDEGSLLHWCLVSQWLLAKALRNEEEQEVRYSNDPFLKENGFTWDFIFVFKVWPLTHYLSTSVYSVIPILYYLKCNHLCTASRV